MSHLSPTTQSTTTHSPATNPSSNWVTFPCHACHTAYMLPTTCLTQPTIDGVPLQDWRLDANNIPTRCWNCAIVLGAITKLRELVFREPWLETEGMGGKPEKAAWETVVSVAGGVGGDDGWGGGKGDSGWGSDHSGGSAGGASGGAAGKGGLAAGAAAAGVVVGAGDGDGGTDSDESTPGDGRTWEECRKFRAECLKNFVETAGEGFAREDGDEVVEK